MTTLELSGVKKRYGTVEALAGIDLTVPTGSRVAIVGPSGSGKSTLLRVIAGFESPDAGRVVLDGAVLSEGGHTVPAHRREIGIVVQDGALFPHMSVAANIAFGLADRAARRNGRVSELMALVGLDPSLGERRPDQISGGQQQRVALARALARQPRLMLLDEPFSALDTALRATTRAAVGDVLSRVGITTVLVTHDQSEALSFADQVAVMHQGRLMQVGRPRDLYLRPDTQMVAEFLGEAIILDAQMAGGIAACALGEIRVDDGAHGAGRIMLRPEQIRLGPITEHGEGARHTIVGEIVAVDFGGAASTVSVRLLKKAPGPADNRFELRLRRSAVDCPAVGGVFEIGVTGSAHVLRDGEVLA